MIYKFCFLLFLPFFVSILFAQEYNTIIKDEETGEPMLIGLTTRDAFQDSSFSLWWNSTYELYDVDSVTVDKIKNVLQDAGITIVMGTWCSDSQYEIPNFYKILDYLNYPSEKVTLINVDRNKKGKGDEVDSLDIKLVPTIIFYRSEKELGRIVESPEASLEKDIFGILTKGDD
jgi:hypothetical protein